MLLFNKNRNNKGKKYIRKKKDIDLVFAEKAELFNQWFKDNHSPVMDYLKDCQHFDGDAFNECYLKIYDNVLYSGLEIENYRSYFIRSYFTILMDSKQKQNRFCEIQPNHDKEDIDPEYFSEIDEKQKLLESDILDYVYSKYNIRDFELFKMYMNLKPAVNYSMLSEITGIKKHNIQRTISKIKKDLKDNQEFNRRRGTGL